MVTERKESVCFQLEVSEQVPNLAGGFALKEVTNNQSN